LENSDAFSKREQADENYYVRQKEMEKLQALKAKIDEHKKHLEELDKHVYVFFVAFPTCYHGGN
jgi:galactokinase